MSYLRCNARNCSNNQNDLCIREGIQVDGATADTKNDTCCNSLPSGVKTTAMWSPATVRLSLRPISSAM